MNVLHFYKTYHPESFGGSEQVINQIIRSTSSLGVESEVLSLTRSGDCSSLLVDGHRVHRARLNLEIASTGLSFEVFGRFKQLANQADLIHYHYPWPMMDLVHFVTRLKKPCLVSYHSDIVRQKKLLKLYQPLQKKFLSSVNKIVAASPNYLKTSQVLAEYPDKTCVIPYGLDETTYPKASTELLSKWRNQLGTRFFLFVGMLRYYKGLNVLLDALQGLDYPMVIVGNGPCEQALQQQALRLGLKQVTFLGAVSEEDKAALLELSYAFVFPSNVRSEAFGISLLEAAMFGKPMISCEIGSGTTYINIHNNTGLVVEPNDSNALAEAMTFLWEQDEVATKMGQQARQRYLDVFTAKQMALSYQALYQSLLS